MDGLRAFHLHIRIPVLISVRGDHVLLVAILLIQVVEGLKWPIVEVQEGHEHFARTGRKYYDIQILLDFLHLNWLNRTVIQVFI